MMVKIGYLYGDLLNLYGGYANVDVLIKRLEESGCDSEVIEYTVEKHTDISECDILICGCGTELSTLTALEDLRPERDTLASMAEEGRYMLFTGTSYGMLLDGITGLDGVTHEGLGIIKGNCVYDEKRRYSEFIMNCGLTASKVLGCINTSSTYKVEETLLFSISYDSASILTGTSEGVQKGNVMATELQGPILWRNPDLLDSLASRLAGRTLERNTSTWRMHCDKGYGHLLNILEEAKKQGRK